MTNPLSLETILTEFSDEYEAWVLKDEASEQYVVIPHPAYPGRYPIHFFMSEKDAHSVLNEILNVNEQLRRHKIIPVKVRLLQACRTIAEDKTPGNADGFVVHPPNEVYEFLDSIKEGS